MHASRIRTTLLIALCAALALLAVACSGPQTGETDPVDPPVEAPVADGQAAEPNNNTAAAAPPKVQEPVLTEFLEQLGLVEASNLEIVYYNDAEEPQIAAASPELIGQVIAVLGSDAEQVDQLDVEFDMSKSVYLFLNTSDGYSGIVETYPDDDPDYPGCAVLFIYRGNSEQILRYGPEVAGQLHALVGLNG